MSDKGYGVSYMMAGDARIFFHVSSKKSCEFTDSQGFVNQICKALADMRMLFLGHDKSIPKQRETAEKIEQTSDRINTGASNHMQANGVNGIAH